MFGLFSHAGIRGVLARWRRFQERMGLRPDWQTPDRQKLGRQGERLATRHVRGQGMRIIERNYSCEEGEIDIIAGDGDTVVFVEVKTRRSLSHGEPESAVNERKRKHVRAVADSFLRRFRRRRDDLAIRFDVGAIDCSRPDAPPAIRHTRDAFSWKQGARSER